MLKIVPIALILLSFVITEKFNKRNPLDQLRSSYQFNRLYGNLPNFRPRDPVTIEYVQAPLMKTYYGDALENMGLFHGGLVIRNDRTGTSYTIDYNTVGSLVDAIIPKIKKTKFRDKKHLQWNNEAIVWAWEDLDQGYWTQRFKVATTNGRTHNRFKHWLLRRFNRTQTNYHVFSVFSKWHDYDLAQREQNFSSHTCQDAVIMFLKKFKRMGAQFEKFNDVSDLPHRTFIRLLIDENSKPKRLVLRDNEERDKLIDFYENLRNFWDNNQDFFMLFGMFIQSYSQKGYLHRELLGRFPVYYKLNMTKLENKMPFNIRYVPDDFFLEMNDITNQQK